MENEFSTRHYVAKNSLDGSAPPDYLFTSGKRNRLNPDGVHCLYLGEDKATALIEYDKYFPDTPPSVLYRVELKAVAVIDLTRAKIQKHFGVTPADLYKGFRRRVPPTLLESLGHATARQDKVCAIRFPSAACKEVGKPGNNLVIYKKSLIAPNSLILHDPNSKNPDRWP